ncbi:MAG: DUF2993 domain-containing protein [Leptolyngbyaceae bacterium]|nr:DUF2993 domain-containing protein [Leptolyngbyaceae bacterium]
MTQKKPKFGEQAVNRFIEMVLARLVKAERLQARIKADFKQLTRGEIDALSILMSGFLLRPHLRVAEFQFEIGGAAVNLQGIMHRRKIELLHPSTGSLQLVITQEQLTHFLRAELLQASEPTQKSQRLEQVDCELQPDEIRFRFQWSRGEEVELGVCTTIPRIEVHSNTVLLDQQGLKEKGVPGELIQAAIAHISSVLSLGDLANQGTTFVLEHLKIEADRVLVKAMAAIDQFPSG